MATKTMTDKKLTARQVIDKIEEYSDENFIIDLERDKNKDSIVKYNITSADIINTIRNLESKNFIKVVKNKDKKIKTNYLYEFHKCIQVFDQYGIADMPRIYIKIGFHHKRCILYVRSFHEDD